MNKYTEIFTTGTAQDAHNYQSALSLMIGFRCMLLNIFSESLQKGKTQWDYIDLTLGEAMKDHITSQIEYLVTNNFVKERRIATNNFSTFYTLTDKGRALVQEWEEDNKRKEQEAYEHYLQDKAFLNEDWAIDSGDNMVLEGE